VVAAGVDRLKQGLLTVCRETRASLTYEELDPDVFGEELSGPAYAGVERIAAVTAVLALRND
jgi:hypothetical protein